MDNLNKATKENTIEELKVLIASSERELNWRLNRVETERVMLLAFRTQLAILEDKNV